MRRLALLAGLALALGTVTPVAATGQSGRCSISVSPSIGSPTDAYRISGTDFPPGSFGSFTDVHIGVVRAGDGRLRQTLFLVLFPGGNGEFYVDYNAGAEEGSSLPPLEPGLYRVRADVNGHECVAMAWFRVAG